MIQHFALVDFDKIEDKIGLVLSRFSLSVALLK
jgi:hypothetical protein